MNVKKKSFTGLIEWFLTTVIIFFDHLCMKIFHGEGAATRERGSGSISRRDLSQHKTLFALELQKVKIDDDDSTKTKK